MASSIPRQRSRSTSPRSAPATWPWQGARRRTWGSSSRRGSPYRQVSSSLPPPTTSWSPPMGWNRRSLRSPSRTRAPLCGPLSNRRRFHLPSRRLSWPATEVSGAAPSPSAPAPPRKTSRTPPSPASRRRISASWMPRRYCPPCAAAGHRSGPTAPSPTAITSASATQTSSWPWSCSGWSPPTRQASSLPPIPSPGRGTRS